MSRIFSKSIDKWISDDRTNYNYKKRKCLKCNKKFKTTKSQRICAECRMENKLRKGVSVW